jgi:hypothetical protein
MRARKKAVLMGMAILAVAMAGLIAPAGGAKSSRVTIGHIAPPGTGGCSNCNSFQWSTSKDSPRYRVPKGRWTLVKWRTRGGDMAEGSARMRVWRETNTDGKYRLIGQSPVKTVDVGDAAAFRAHIDVKRGDLLGLYAITGIAAGYSSADAEDVGAGASCFDGGGVGDSVGTGTSCAIVPIEHSLANVAATLKRR